MKRSEMNGIIMDFERFLAEHRFMLPVWASWKPEEWKGKYDICSEIIDNKLGWDITDFGSGDFNKRGLSLFTIRNGNWDKKDKMYCEKIMVSDEEQETPMHYHWAKTEDIINRGGGNLVMELYNATNDDKLSPEPVTVSIDGVLTTVEAGKPLILKPGQSVCLKSRLYHRFYGEKGSGKVLIGEVSLVNDDAKDNKFYEEIGRFPEIEEDEKPHRLLVNDYEKYL
ncbi:MAG TPA: D-lyxose/D-mannose family sugar isomerase [Bacteroidales bacterium]|nr:D-lyxose/D-mannose family sugar isomerase [Bacteroidales bacterium]